MIKFYLIIFAIQLILIFAHSFPQNGDIYFREEELHPALDSECVTIYKTLGRCTRVHDCPRDRIKFNLQDICYFEQKHPVVCCEQAISGFPILAPIKRPSKTPSEGDLGSNKEKVSEKIVEADRNTQTQTVDATSTTTSKDTIVAAPPSPPSISVLDNYDIFSTRVQNSGRISNKYCTQTSTSGPDTSNILYVGGKLSLPGANPQMAAIGWRTIDGVIDWKCGGSLISPDFVLTAAHCTSDRGQPAEVIRVGDINLLKPNGDLFAQEFNITEIRVHPEYKRRLVYHDIALLKIAPNSTLRPACVWSEPDVPVTELLAMGYGTDAFAGKKTNELYEGNLTHVQNEECSITFGTDTQIPQGIIDSQICAKDPKGIQDTCQGDSGGPLLFRTGSGAFLRQHLVGITSFGESCAGPTPGVYTRVSSYIDWIESVVWPLGQL